MSTEMLETVLMLSLFAGGAVAGVMSRWAPASGWAALGLAVVLPPLGIALTRLFC
jgi:hypothetical protein